MSIFIDILNSIQSSRKPKQAHIVKQDELMHYGRGHLDGGHSGRHPWGSGEEPYQHDGKDFLDRIDILKKDGWTETPENIMKEFKMTTTEYRMEKANAKNEREIYRRSKIQGYLDEGKGWTEIGRIMGMPEGTIRSMMNKSDEAKAKASQARVTADFIKEQIKEKGIIDVGSGVEREIGISSEKLNQALKLLEEEGYPVYNARIEQVTNRGKYITQKVIGKPGTEYKDVYDPNNIHSLTDYVALNGGDEFVQKIVYPKSLDSSRVKVLLKDEPNPIDGEPGVAKDGLIQIRRGVEDLNLGDSRYAQVRIMVDGNKYLKGMAVYADNMPDGVDVIFNSNKTSYEKALKDIKTDDPSNPFGSLIKKQIYYKDKDGNTQLSPINIPREEGDWSEWSNGLPSQFLSKQARPMAKQQLNLAKATSEEEFESYKQLTNPVIKKYLLNKFADSCDSAAVDLKAAALPGQKYHVIIPINTLKEDEIYAPNYENGTKLALIRYPHGGTFEIPIVTVNNKNVTGRKILGTDVPDAVGINHKVAERLSGADFDGDTVMCIPTHDAQGKVKITSRSPLEDLVGFDPQDAYPAVPGMKYMKDPVTGKDATQSEMGKISNLITDMTLAGADDKEMARAVRHSMVVIDAGKHKLNYKKSEKDNDIAGLIERYQRTIQPDGSIKIGGASTLISQAKGERQVLRRQGNPIVNIKENAGKTDTKGNPLYDPSRPEGALLYKVADNLTYSYTKTNKRTGVETVVTKERTQKSTRMAETDDARTLVSAARHPMELVYADYANSMKNLANKARVEAYYAGKIAVNKEAKSIYKEEVDSLNKKLNKALLNTPREREAQRLANAEVEARRSTYKEANGGTKMKPGDVKKISQQAIVKYRDAVGATSRKKRNIDITDREWEAIQAGAISENKLNQILNNTDIDALRKRATPKTSSTSLNKAQVNRIKAMSASNYTLDEIAKQMGISSSTVSKYLKGE